MRTEREPCGDLCSPARSAREKHAGDVCARHEPNRSHEQERHGQPGIERCGRAGSGQARDPRQRQDGGVASETDVLTRICLLEPLGPMTTSDSRVDILPKWNTALVDCQPVQTESRRPRSR
jgi:hypothetical protein